MSNYSNKSYAELKDDAQTLREAISAKQEERQALVTHIIGIKEKIDRLGQTLLQEESAMASASKLKQPTMTASEFIAMRKEIEVMQGELPQLNDAFLFLDRSIDALQGDLRIIQSWISRKVDQASIEFIPLLATSLIEKSGDDFKNLVAAVVAHKNIQTSFSRDATDLFLHKASLVVCEALIKALQDAEGYRLPDLGDAKRFVADRLDVAQAA